MINLVKSNHNLTAEHLDAVAILKAANEVLDLQEKLINAYKQLESAATTDDLKSECLSQASNMYTKKSLIITRLEKEGVKKIQ